MRTITVDENKLPELQAVVHWLAFRAVFLKAAKECGLPLSPDTETDKAELDAKWRELTGMVGGKAKKLVKSYAREFLGETIKL